MEQRMGMAWVVKLIGDNKQVTRQRLFFKFKNNKVLQGNSFLGKLD